MALYDEYLKKAAATRPAGAGQDNRLAEARRRLAAQEASGRPVGQAAPLSGQPMPGLPTPQMRNVAGQFGTGMGVQNRFAQAAQSRQPGGGGDTVPAMLSPGEAVIPAQQAAALARAGLLDDATGVPQKHMIDQLRYRDAAIARGAVLGFQSGGVVPSGATTSTAPPKQAIEPQTGFQAPQIAPQQPAAPAAPGLGQVPPQYQTDYQGIPQFSEQLQGQVRAQESQRLQNIERARLAELGSAAASSGALLGGDVKQIAAGINAERIQAEAKLGTDLALNAFQMQREDALHLLDDRTSRYIADLRARTDLEMAHIQNPDPTTLQTILTSAGSLAEIFHNLGISPGDAIGFLGDKLGGALFGSGGGGVGHGAGPGDVVSGQGGGFNFGTAARVGAGAFGAYELAHSWGGTGGVGQAALGGAGVGFAVGGPIGAGIGAVIGAAGELAGIGPSEERIRRDTFTKAFDGLYQNIQSTFGYPASNPQSYWNPANKAAVANAFRQFARTDATEGNGISGPDWQRIRGLGLAEYIPDSGGRGGWFLLDDPRVLAMTGGGGPAGEHTPIDIKITVPLGGKPNEGLRRDTGASLSQLIASGHVTITDRATGQPVNINDPAVVAAYAQRMGNVA